MTESEAPERMERPDMARVVYGIIAWLPLVVLFGSAYDAIDQEFPEVELAQGLHIAVIVAAAGTLILGGFLTYRRPWVHLGTGLGAILGLGLWQAARNYSSTTCYDGDCSTTGGAIGAIMGITFAVLAMGAIMVFVIRAMDRSEDIPFVTAATGLAAAAMFLVASSLLLARLQEEARRAEASNVPQHYFSHDIPGIGALAVVGVLLMLAWAARRRPD